MGNPVAPQLAIIYMNYIESKILNLLPNCIFWQRYIDDIFIVYEHNDSVDILNIANSVNNKTQFTIEYPNNDGHLPFLDCKIFLDNNSFHFNLYSKPIHSGCIFNYNSHSSVQTKLNIITGELHRANRNSSSDDNKLISRNLILSKFKNNNYPSSFLNKAICKYESHLTSNKTKPDIFLRIPYINEKHKRDCLNTLRRTNLDNHINLCFITSPSLKKLFRPPKEKVKCKDNCNTCKCSCKPNLCFSKNVIHQINCNICNKIYIGQTCRTIKSHISEHTKVTNSAVHIHFTTFHPTHNIDFTWKILHNNIANNNKREILESIYISKVNIHSLMNNCKGRDLHHI